MTLADLILAGESMAPVLSRSLARGQVGQMGRCCRQAQVGLKPGLAMAPGS